ncbi:MAG TPA: tRNA epoxyqueuosine(34) reductase QueG [Hyphomicrobiaceae bacterium]|nr:tRNA epoxyqueuosine(34) reductase QueG [Hyphomicrobiaceae bacterium]
MLDTPTPAGPREETADCLKTELKARAERLGFAGLRFTTPEAIGPAGEQLHAFLAEARHGDMDWMARTAERRADPKVLWKDVRTILMAGMSYAPAGDPLAGLAQPSRGVISCYAQGRDYHEVLKAKLADLARHLQQRTGAEVKIFVDTAPLMEKPLAAAAGLGWQGKHTNLVSRRHGSWLFLGAILTAAEIAPDAPEADHCGSCRRCLAVCPTDAFPAPYQLDARRCIAYLTIEHKGHIPEPFRRPMGNRVFGCDDCLAVCPWNKFAAAAREHRFAARHETDNPPLAELLTLDDVTFRQRFAGTPIKRTGRDRFLRNVLIAAGNSADATFVPRIRSLVTDPSPLVRAMAVWALAQLAPEEARNLRLRLAPRERDPEVLAEWGRSALHPTR